MPAGYRPLYSLRDVATAPVTGATVDVGISDINVGVQIMITGTATVELQASSDGIYFLNVSEPDDGTDSYTYSTIVELPPLVPFYRAVVTSRDSGTVTVIFGCGKAGRLLANVSETGSGLLA